MRWLWASYQTGVWHGLLFDGLTQSAFAESMREVIGSVDYDWIIEVQSSDGYRPVGLILAVILPNGRSLEPHVEWFPWASDRNKLEGIACYLKEVSKRFKIYVNAEDKDVLFYTRLAQYRMLRRGCKVLDYFARGEHAMFFYTPVGP